MHAQQYCERVDDYDKEYMKIKFNSNDKLLLNKTIEIPGIIIVARAIFRIQIHGGVRYLVLFNCSWFDKTFDWIKYLSSEKMI